MASSWFVYIVECADGSLYTGVTTDITRRVEQHNAGRAGARYTRGRRPVRLVYSEVANDRSGALVREIEIKQMDRAGKQMLVACADSGGKP